MLDFLNKRLEEWLGAFLLAVMACVAFANVIVRYCTNFSFAASEEITVNFFVWIVLLGTSRAFREGSNFSMNLLYDALPRSIRKVLYIFSILCCLTFFAALAYEGYIEVMDEMDLDVVSESLAIPVWLYTICTPVFSILIIVRILQKVWDDLRIRNY